VRYARERGDAAAEAHWAARLRDADPEPASARASAPPDPAPVPPIGGLEVAPYDPVVGLDDAPADPLPSPMREALPTLAEAEGKAEDVLAPSDVPSDAPPPELAGAAPPPAAPFVTETMAGLLAAQGHTAQALEVYGQLLAQRPDDARLRARVEALRGGATADEGAAPNAPPERDAWAAAMWRAALGPVPNLASEPGIAPAVDAAPAPPAPAEALAEAPVAPGSELESELDDLSFDRFFEAFGDEPDPAPAEPAGDFERWAATVAVPKAGAAPAPPRADPAPGTTVPAAVAPVATPGYAPDDPDDDLAAFNAWLRGVDG
jgi:hypothetical protein